MLSNLRVEKLQVGYERNIVFQELDFAVQTGKITTIIGPNGCGKSTLLKTMGRIIRQRSGSVYLYNEDMRSLDTREIARKLALLPQSPVAPNELKAEELVAYGRFPHLRQIQQSSAADAAAIEWAIKTAKITKFRYRQLGSLSGGERQKVWLAMALAQQTSILLLDEPTTYLDMVHQLEVLNIVRQLNQEQQCTIIMVLHDINHAARFSHQIVAMKGGKIIASGCPREIITPEVLRQVFQIEARIMADPRDGIPICFSYDNVSGDLSTGGVA